MATDSETEQDKQEAFKAFRRLLNLQAVRLVEESNAKVKDPFVDVIKGINRPSELPAFLQYLEDSHKIKFSDDVLKGWEESKPEEYR